MKKKRIYSIILLIVILSSVTGCDFLTQNESMAYEEEEEIDDNAEEIERPEGWSEETHSNDVEPDYETVFPQDEVNRLDIIISEENWETMLTDMTELMGEFGQGDAVAGGNGGNFQPGNQAPEGNIPQQPEDDGTQEENNIEQPQQDIQPPEDENRQPQWNNPQDRQGDAVMDMDGANDENPIWVTATIEFEENIWENVGIRFKGNSSLKSAWTSGNLKIPFKLDFDQFEDDFPEIEDQRFYGFKQLTLASNFNDNSFLREKVAADIFRDFGVPSANTAFYEVYVDYGEGPVYFGLYTMVEVVDDTVIEEQFESDEGNLYKPSGTGATFAANSFNEASFDKETNQDEDDYSDILSLYDTLHADNRLTDPEAWRAGLEEVFDVDTFLRWLAVNTVIQNWDTYGIMNHNYYLYTNPEDGLITWIPWDNNHALSGTGKQASASLSLDEISDSWPLIRFLMDDPVYQAEYEAYIQEVVETVFDPETMAETYAYYHDLIAPYALAETDEATMLDSAAAFESSLDELTNHAYERYQAVIQYLSK